MALLPLIYCTFTTIAMAIYSDKQLVKAQHSPDTIINHFMIVLTANIAASFYMLYCIFVAA